MVEPLKKDDIIEIPRFEIEDDSGNRLPVHHVPIFVIEVSRVKELLEEHKRYLEELDNNPLRDLWDEGFKKGIFASKVKINGLFGVLFDNGNEGGDGKP